jgi:OHCU decarboxylase
VNGLERLNAMSSAEAEASLLACCAALKWARGMEKSRPFASEIALYTTAERRFAGLDRDDWLAAFATHPRIGERATGWSQQEQAQAASAASSVLTELALANRRYEERFGHIFIVCATGKTVEEMLALLTSRLDNDPPTELAIAAAEQSKITRLRLEKLVRS